MSTTARIPVDRTTVGASVVDSIPGGPTVTGEPQRGAATVGVEVYAVATWTDGDDQYVEVVAHMAGIDHERRDSRGLSGVEVFRTATHGVTERHRTIAPIARALAAGLLDRKSVEDAPDHVRQLAEREAAVLVAAALQSAVERVYR